MAIKGIKGILKYTVDDKHPDYRFMSDKMKHGINTVSDAYSFDIYDPITNPGGYWDSDDTDGMKEYVKHDLALVAGGGYSSKHIKVISFTTEPAQLITIKCYYNNERYERK